jgi:aryl-alcohol dehydrogenase-like predicted oxidoreductase
VRPTVYQVCKPPLFTPLSTAGKAQFLIELFQGNYSILVRKGEDELFPLLKQQNVAFYAWSPLAAGLLTGRYKNKEEIANNASHFSHPQVYLSSCLSSPL